MARLLLLTTLVAAAVAYLQVRVPLAGPRLGHADVIHYSVVALIAGLVVLILSAAVAWASMRAGRGGE